MSTDPRTYLTGVIDQLGAAVRDGETETAERVLDMMDADGHVRAAAVLTRAVQRTSLGPALAEPPLDTTTDASVSDALRTAVDRVIAVSRWVDGAPANAARDPEALTWIRVAKCAEEAGEAIDALNRATGANPRKTERASMTEVSTKLLDTALTALAAYEHLNGHLGSSLAALFSHIENRWRRVGLNTGDASS